MILFVSSAFILAIVIFVIVQLCIDLSAWKKKKDEEWKKFCHVLTSEQRAHISSLESENLKLENDCRIYKNRVKKILKKNSSILKRNGPIPPYSWCAYRADVILDFYSVEYEYRYEYNYDLDTFNVKGFDDVLSLSKNGLSESCISKLYDLYILYRDAHLEIDKNEQTIYNIKKNY